MSWEAPRPPWAAAQCPAGGGGYVWLCAYSFSAILWRNWHRLPQTMSRGTLLSTEATLGRCEAQNSGWVRWVGPFYWTGCVLLCPCRYVQASQGTTEGWGGSPTTRGPVSSGRGLLGEYRTTLCHGVLSWQWCNEVCVYCRTPKCALVRGIPVLSATYHTQP